MIVLVTVRRFDTSRSRNRWNRLNKRGLTNKNHNNHNISQLNGIWRLDYSFKRQPLSLFIRLILHYKARNPAPPTELTFHLLRSELTVSPQRWGRCQLQLTAPVLLWLKCPRPASWTLPFAPAPHAAFRSRGNFTVIKEPEVFPHDNRHDMPRIQEVRCNFRSRVYHWTGEVNAALRLTLHVLF